MRRARIVALLLVFAAQALPAGVARAAVGSPANEVAGRALVRFAAGTSPAARAATLRTIGARALRSLGHSGYTLVGFAVSTPVSDAVRALSRARVVARVEPDFIGHAAIDPNDPCAAGCATDNATVKQWDVDAVAARDGWGIFPGHFQDSTERASTVPVKVAVLDTKITPSEPLTNAEWQNGGAPANDPWDARNGGQLDVADAADFVSADGQQGPQLYHGTFVAGILGAAANNGVGIAGFGYSAQLMPVNVVDGAGNVSADALIQGIAWAVDHGARVVNMSLGIANYSDAVQREISADTGSALMVAAAGNFGNDGPFYPAQMSGVMSVGATDEADRIGTCSNHNSFLSVAAPGVNVVSLDIRRHSGLGIVGCGTSTATPHVSALAALLFMQDPARTPKQVRSIIESTADDDRYTPGRDDYFGHGRVDFSRALAVGDSMLNGRRVPAQIDRISTTFPRPLGGVSVGTALAFAQAPKTIIAAQWRLDTGQSGSLTPQDGAFDSQSEQVTSEIDVPLDTPQGAHHIFMRAQDADGWGPWSAGVLLVDRTPPTITKATADPTGSALTPVTAHFHADDDLSSYATYSIAVFPQIGPNTTTPVYVSQPRTETTPGDYSVEWVPQLTDVGPYCIQITVSDEAGNVSRTMVGTLIV